MSILGGSYGQFFLHVGVIFAMKVKKCQFFFSKRFTKKVAALLKKEEKKSDFAKQTKYYEKRNK